MRGADGGETSARQSPDVNVGIGAVSSMHEERPLNHRLPWAFPTQGMIRCNALDRQMSSDEVEKDVLKLIMNALFGNFLQNNENYTETNTFTDCEKWLRATWKICGDKRHFDIVQGSVNSVLRSWRSQSLSCWSCIEPSRTFTISVPHCASRIPTRSSIFWRRRTTWTTLRRWTRHHQYRSSIFVKQVVMHPMPANSDLQRTKRAPSRDWRQFGNLQQLNRRCTPWRLLMQMVWWAAPWKEKASPLATWNVSRILRIMPGS